MYNTTTVNTCLKPTVALADAAIYAPTYLTASVIASAIPAGAQQGTVLSDILTGSVTKMMGDVIRIKKVTNTVRSVIDDFSLFEGKADFDIKNANKGRFVGLMLNLKTHSDIQLSVFKVAFQGDMACPGLKIYLFNSDLDAAIAVMPFNYDTPRSVKWIDFVVNSQPVGSIGGDDGVYYLGYFESDLATGAQSIKKTLDFVNQPTCSTCNQSYYNQYQKRVKYLNIQPFYVDSNHINGVTLFDTNKVNYTDFNNWGLNIKVTVSCDISDFICRNKALFYDALSMRYCLDILNYLLMNTRNSAVLEQFKSGIIFLRDGDKANGKDGFEIKYEEAIEALNVDLSGFNEMCLPTKMNPGVRRAYIG
jgi:hypothetical protein